MEIFEQNIINAFGVKGGDWLQHLPYITKKLSRVWQLKDIKPVSNMNWNYVAKATQNFNNPVVLKISYDLELVEQEYNALRIFCGQGAIKLLGFNKKYKALLLEQALPGNTLKTTDISLEQKINIYADIVYKLKSNPIPENHNFKHVRDWLKSIDYIIDVRIDNHLVELAQKVKLHILATIKEEYLCHGDLHLENIISHKDKWLAIDPKGIIGEIAFELSAFDLIDKQEIEKGNNISSLILERTRLLADVTGIEFKRLLEWIFLRTMLSAQWFIEDKGDPSFIIIIAEHIYQVIKNRAISN